MKLIAGLGNPGPRYADSRHNVGYLVVEELARRWAADLSRYHRDFQGLIGRVEAAGRSVLLLKPATYMNASGRSVAAVWRFYKLASSDLLVIYDDLDLPVGQLRLRAAGSPGGHKGMSDVIQHLGTDQIPRLRIGIGRVHPAAAVEYVLSSFDPDQRAAIQAALGPAAEAAECWLREGIEAAMNQFNRSPEAESPGDSRSEGEPS